MDSTLPIDAIVWVLFCFKKTRAKIGRFLIRNEPLKGRNLNENV
jgi:hypothetical protein